MGTDGGRRGDGGRGWLTLKYKETSRSTQHGAEVLAGAYDYDDYFIVLTWDGCRMFQKESTSWCCCRLEFYSRGRHTIYIVFHGKKN